MKTFLRCFLQENVPPFGGLVLLFVGLTFGCSNASYENTSDIYEMKAEPFTVWLKSEGRVDSLKTQPVSLQYRGRSAVTYVAPEGALLNEGDLLTSFDDEELRIQLAKGSRNMAQAKADLQTLLEATHPLQLADLREQLSLKQRELSDEVDYYKNILPLIEEGLLPAADGTEQREVLQVLSNTVAVTQKRLSLLKTVIHPAEVRKAEAVAEEATSELARIENQLASSTVRALWRGQVLYQPIHIGGTYRSVREGDQVYRNQTFLKLADPSSLVVKCHIPEADWQNVSVDMKARLRFPALPDIEHTGTVSQVGNTAISLPGRPDWQRFFEVTLTLGDTPPDIRTGMTVEVDLRVYSRQNALTLPRSLVVWEGGTPYAFVLRGGNKEKQPLTLLGAGRTTATHFEVMEGLQEGDLIVRP